MDRYPSNAHPDTWIWKGSAADWATLMSMVIILGSVCAFIIIAFLNQP